MIEINELKTLYIGKQGENEASIAVFDLSSWIEEYGAGTAKLLHKRSKDELPYIAQTTQSGSTLSWIFTKDDTAYSGYGKAQLNYYVDDMLAKTLIFTTKCDKSLTDETETPKEVKSALDLIAGTVDSKLSPSNIIAGDNVTIDVDGNDVTINSTGGGSGTGNYDDLENKPSINSVELSGNKSLADLGIQPSGDYATASEMSAEENARQNADLALQNGKQDTLVSQTNIKSINGQSILGSGDLTVGGGTSFTPDSTLYLENSILGIDFADDTGSGLETGKAVRSNEFNSAMNTISTTFGGFVTQLAGKEDAFIVGKGLRLANGVLSADVRRWLFVSALPTTDIDQEAIYLRKHARYFPQLVDSQGNSLIQKIEGVDQKVAVTEDGKFIRFNTTGNTFYSSLNTIKAFEYDIYITDGTSWTYASSSTTGGDTSWATAMGWDVTETYSNILYSNCDFRYTGAFKHYDPSTNRAKVDGTAENTSTLPPYIFMMWEYNGSSWEELGICDFTELFNKVETEIASKADASTTYTKTEVDTALATKQDKTASVTLTDGSTVALDDNTEYVGTGLTDITFTYPSGDFECYLVLNFASSGTITVTFPTSQYIGSAPTFANSETWEISIKNGVIVAGKVE